VDELGLVGDLQLEEQLPLFTSDIIVSRPFLIISVVARIALFP
jgi:hypothetical protein